MKCRGRASRGHCGAVVTAGGHDLGGHALGGIGLSESAGCRGHPREPLRVGEQRLNLGDETIGVEVLVLDDPGGAGPLHPVRIRMLMASGGMRVRHQDRRLARSCELEDRAARTREDQIAGGERVGEIRQVVDQRVPSRRGEVRLNRRIVACPGDVEDVEGSLRRRPAGPERISSRPVDPQRAEAAAEDQQAGDVGSDPEPLPRPAAVRPGDRRRDRAAGDQIAAPVTARDRERQADAVGAAAPAGGSRGRDGCRPRSAPAAVASPRPRSLPARQRIRLRP